MRSRQGSYRDEWVRHVAWSLMIVLSGCGGGSSTSPSAATSATPAPVVTNSMTAAASVTSGSITTVACVGETGSCSTGLTVNIDVTFNVAVTNAQVYFQVLDSTGRQCASRLSTATSIAVGASTRFTIASVRMDCNLPFAAASSRATLFGNDSGTLPVSQRTGLFAQNFTGTWTFLATPGATPTPTATPTQTPSDGFPVCGGNRPTGQCINDQPGQATGRCTDGAFTCSTSRTGTCSSHGGLQCAFCPGPLC